MAQFIASSLKMVLGGTPLSLSVYDEGVTQTLYTDPPTEYTKTVYAINIIRKSDTTRITNSEISLVWNGIRYAVSQDSDGKLYLNTIYSGLSSSPVRETIIGGVPIGIGEYNELMFHDSGYSIENIDRYSYIMLGGVPITVGQINNKWYLVIRTL